MQSFVSVKYQYRSTKSKMACSHILITFYRRFQVYFLFHSNEHQGLQHNQLEQLKKASKGICSHVFHMHITKLQFCTHNYAFVERPMSKN